MGSAAKGYIPTGLLGVAFREGSGERVFQGGSKPRVVLYTRVLVFPQLIYTNQCAGGSFGLVETVPPILVSILS